MTRLAGQTRAVEHEMEALAGIVKLGLTAVFDAQHGGVATGWSPVSWGLIDELFVNLTMPNSAISPTRRPGILSAVMRPCRRTASPHSTPRSDSMVSATWR